VKKKGITALNITFKFNYTMGLFDNYIKKTTKEENTTDGFFIGSSEAEGEINNSIITLDEVFNDYLDILPQINHEKFIITGRKGSGKSAIGEYLYYLSNNDPNLFCDFIRKGEIDIELMVQIGEKEGTLIQQELLFKWVILTKILSLIAKNEAVQDLPEMKHLKLFIERNRGFIDIRKGEILEIIKTDNFGVQSEYFKRFISATLNKEVKIKETKPIFYKLLPYLEEAVVKILSKDPDNKYVLIFDDLDIGFSIKDKSNVDNLTSLVRISKYYNNDVFGRNGISSKIILLLRDDIAKYLKFNADTAKIFASYEVPIKWYEESQKWDENNIKLKKFICNRIEKNFIKYNIPYNKTTIWESFIDESSFYGGAKTSFKYVIDHTFFRPRDLILFFKDISSQVLCLPISKTDLYSLIGKYANEIICEIYNELSASFSPNEIDMIFRVLEYHANTNFKPLFTFDELKSDLEGIGFNEDVETVINQLFDYSLIGNICDNEINVSFKFREKGLEICKLNPNQNIILHYVLKVYFKNHTSK